MNKHWARIERDAIATVKQQQVGNHTLEQDAARDHISRREAPGASFEQLELIRALYLHSALPSMIGRLHRVNHKHPLGEPNCDTILGQVHSAFEENAGINPQRIDRGRESPVFIDKRKRQRATLPTLKVLLVATPGSQIFRVETILQSAVLVLQRNAKTWRK